MQPQTIMGVFYDDGKGNTEFKEGVRSAKILIWNAVYMRKSIETSFQHLDLPLSYKIV